MSSKTIDIYFTYLSPYAFLANSRIKKALEPLKVILRYQPVAHTGTSDGPVFNETRYEHIVEEDVPRFAKRYGLAYIPKPPLTESYTASSGTAAAGLVADDGPLLILLVLLVTVAIGLYLLQQHTAVGIAPFRY